MQNIDDEFGIASDSQEEQYLLFLVDAELYAIEALSAKEIVEYVSVTKVPMVSKFVKGVTNIRGNIVPVIDLQNRFSLGETDIGDKTSIVVINYKQDDTDIHIGVMIDEVYEVDVIEKANLRDKPQFGSKIPTRFIAQMGKYEKNYVPILDMDKILDISELSKLYVKH